jgi:hypothetical protein
MERPAFAGPLESADFKTLRLPSPIPAVPITGPLAALSPIFRGRRREPFIHRQRRFAMKRCGNPWMETAGILIFHAA